MSQTGFEIEVDFGESVSGFDSGDLAVLGGTASTAIDLGDGRYRVAIDALGDGTITVGLPAGVAIDQAGRQNLAGNDLSIIVDSQAYAATISSTEPNPTTAIQIVSIIDFGKPVTGFEATDLTITGGTVGVITPLDDGPTR